VVQRTPNVGNMDKYSCIDAPVIYQHPLAYLLGLEGVALLRAFSGGYDRDFTVARFREALHRYCPAATNAAWRGQPAAIILHFPLSPN
jgi:hypothetical protein